MFFSTSNSDDYVAPSNGKNSFPPLLIVKKMEQHKYEERERKGCIFVQDPMVTVCDFRDQHPNPLLAPHETIKHKK